MGKIITLLLVLGLIASIAYLASNVYFQVRRALSSNDISPASCETREDLVCSSRWNLESVIQQKAIQWRPQPPKSPT